MSLEAICEKAARVGKDIDLQGCEYGLHKRTARMLGVLPYYFFLAGFAKSLKLKTVLEIGTHLGGSLNAIRRGCVSVSNDIKLVTVDKTSLIQPPLKDFPDVYALQGDAFDKGVIAQAARIFSAPIDLLFIDSEHRYAHTKQCLDVYVNYFDPQYIILDDIKLNSEMELVWTESVADNMNETFDASDLAERECGFGVIARKRISHTDATIFIP